MRRGVMVGVVLALVLLMPTSILAQDGDSTRRHTVQAGENLYRIAQQYGTTVFAIAEANNITNPNIIVVGQELIIPEATTEPSATEEPTDEATATPTEEPTEFITYQVQQGDNLFRIAAEYNTTVRAISELNGITNPNLIVTGTTLRIPVVEADVDVPPDATEEAGETPIPTAVPVDETPVSEATSTEAAPEATEEPTEVAVEPTAEEGGEEDVVDMPESAVAFDYGIEVELFGQDKQAVIERVNTLGVSWIKQEVDWSVIEPVQGNIVWTDLDEIINLANANNLNLMLTLKNAPDWARSNTENAGPPDDYAAFAAFAGSIAGRYVGSVNAYEVWDEPNVASNWTGKPLNGASYVELLSAAYTAIKTADPNAVVVSGGLRPTGLNDPNVAIDDRVFLSQMYGAGLADVSDAVGAHPVGFANPPDSTCCENNPEIPGWDDHPSFFFLNILQDYRSIMNQNGDDRTFIWATEFGWGSS
ncbi:MAG: LysM peptidoglycan-binding domain-containing protein, partial [Chloroflexi bacterium]|nr:LysM peptidoglycan-binding domain-containing protein [Chloroflexota bacterium]